MLRRQQTHTELIGYLLFLPLKKELSVYKLYTSLTMYRLRNLLENFETNFAKLLLPFEPPQSG